MKPQLLKVPAQPRNSFSVRHDSVPHFYNHWHFHPEIELISILKGRGTQFIGDHISHFQEGDVLLVGAGLPHLWRCEEMYHRGDEALRAEAVVVHFLPDFWGRDFLELPELLPVRELLRKAARGISLRGGIQQAACRLLPGLLEADGAERVARLLTLLHRIAAAPETELHLLSIAQFDQTAFDHTDHHRLNLIYTFTLTHYQRAIKLHELSDLVSLSRLAFCRYFKAKTGKTYSQFLKEVRVGQACKLLIENKLSLSQIAIDCGYNNYANFTRQFAGTMHLTPLAYRKNYIR